MSRSSLEDDRSETPLLAVDLHKTFVDGDHEVEVLRGIDLELRSGELVALLGPSGSGKSTLLSILGTLLRPTSGQLFIDEVEVSRARSRVIDRVRNQSLGFVFQFHHLLPDFSALENVLMPWTGCHGPAPAEVRHRAQDLLERVGLADRMRFRIGKLSGGQKQRVAIARALILRPAVVLADEPTGNLDRENAFEVMELLHEISSHSKTGFLISTHDPEIAARCDRRIEIEAGKVKQ